MRSEREIGIGSGRCRRSRSKKGREDWNRMVRDLRLTNTAWPETISPGEKYPEGGMFERVRLTRSIRDKRSFGSAENEM